MLRAVWRSAAMAALPCPGVLSTAREEAALRRRLQLAHRRLARAATAYRTAHVTEAARACSIVRLARRRRGPAWLTQRQFFLAWFCGDCDAASVLFLFFWGCLFLLLGLVLLRPRALPFPRRPRARPVPRRPRAPRPALSRRAARTAPPGSSCHLRRSARSPYSATSSLHSPTSSRVGQVLDQVARAEHVVAVPGLAVGVLAQRALAADDEVLRVAPALHSAQRISGRAAVGRGRAPVSIVLIAAATSSMCPYSLAAMLATRS